MEQIRIIKSREPLNDNITLYFDGKDDAREYLKLLRKTWPKTAATTRSLKFKENKKIYG